MGLILFYKPVAYMFGCPFGSELFVDTCIPVIVLILLQSAVFEIYTFCSSKLLAGFGILFRIWISQLCQDHA